MIQFTITSSVIVDAFTSSMGGALERKRVLNRMETSD